MPPRLPNTVPALNEESRILLIGLVAELVGPEDRVAEMANYKITPEMIPNPDDDQEIQFCRKVLELCYRATGDHKAPTREYMMPYLAFTFGQEDAERLWEWLLSKRSIDADLPGAVNGSAMVLFDWMTLRRLQIGAEGLVKIAYSSESMALDMYERMQQVMHQIAPMKRIAPPKSMVENLEASDQEFLHASELLKQKKETGPRTLWPSVNAEMAGWNKGELALISAKTSFGKSVMAWLITEYVAWIQGGYNVLLLHYEQYDTSIVARLMARYFRLFPKDFRTPRLIDPASDEWRKRVQQIKAKIVQYEATKGHIWLVDGAKMDTNQIEAVVSEKRGISAKEGRELLVIHDYLDLIDSSKLQIHGYNEVARLHAVIDFLRDDLSGQYDCYSLVFAQDDVKTWYPARLMPYNSQRVYQRSQFYMRLERIFADDSERAKDEEGKDVTDMLGREVYYHQIGEPHSQSLFHIIKASDGQAGKYIPVRFWNGRMRIAEMKLTPDEKLDLIKAINEGSKKFAGDRVDKE